MGTDNQRQAPVLTNRFRLDESTLRSVVKERLRTTILLNWISAAGMLALAVYTGIVCLRTAHPGFGLVFRPLFCLAVTGFLLYQAITVENRSARQVIAEIDRAVGSRDSDVILTFGPDCFFSENSLKPGPSRRAYQDIVSLKRGGSWIFLDSKIGAYDLDPARFENGTEADFWKLMNEKCPKAVPGKYRAAPGAQ